MPHEGLMASALFLELIEALKQEHFRALQRASRSNADGRAFPVTFADDVDCLSAAGDPFSTSEIGSIVQKTAGGGGSKTERQGQRKTASLDSASVVFDLHSPAQVLAWVQNQPDSQSITLAPVVAGADHSSANEAEASASVEGPNVSQASSNLVVKPEVGDSDDTQPSTAMFIRPTPEHCDDHQPQLHLEEKAQQGDGLHLQSPSPDAEIMLGLESVSYPNTMESTSTTSSPNPMQQQQPPSLLVLRCTASRKVGVPQPLTSPAKELPGQTVPLGPTASAMVQDPFLGVPPRTRPSIARALTAPVAMPRKKRGPDSDTFSEFSDDSLGSSSVGLPGRVGGLRRCRVANGDTEFLGVVANTSSPRCLTKMGSQGILSANGRKRRRERISVLTRGNSKRQSAVWNSSASINSAEGHSSIDVEEPTKARFSIRTTSMVSWGKLVSTQGFQLRPCWEDEDPEAVEVESDCLCVVDDPSSSYVHRMSTSGQTTSDALGQVRSGRSIQQQQSQHQQQQQQQQQQQPPKSKTSKCEIEVFHPQSTPRFIANCMALFFMLWDIITIPLSMAFNLPETTFLTLMDWATSLYWTLDVFVSLNSAYYLPDGDIVESRVLILIRYIRTWFLLDVLILVPEYFILWTELLSGGGVRGGVARLDTMGLFRGLRVLRILRLLRLVKLDKIWRQLKERINSSFFLLFIGVARLIGALTLGIHWLACGWYWIGTEGDSGWVQSIVDTSGAQSDFHWYVTSVHWSLTQFHGSTDVNPVSTRERGIAVIVLMIALIVFSSFLSSITHMMMQISSLRQEQTIRMRTLLGFLDDHSISLELSVRVKKFVESASIQSLQSERQVELLHILPKQMLMDLHYEARSPFLVGHRFFHQYQRLNHRALRQVCHDALLQSSYFAEDTIFASGDACEKMFFVHWGVAKYTPSISMTGAVSSKITDGEDSKATRSRQSRQSWTSPWSGSRSLQTITASSCGQNRRELTKGRWLAESLESDAALWTRWVHRGDLQATTTTNMLCLDAMKFESATRMYADCRIMAVAYAESFLRALNNTRHPTDVLDFNVRRLRERISEEEEF